MTKTKKMIEAVKEQPAILIVVVIVAALIVFKGCERTEKVKYFENEGVISNTKTAKSTSVVATTKPATTASAPAVSLRDENEGIISFEMYLPQQKKAAARALTRDESIRQIVESVSRIADDLIAKNFIVNQVNALQFKVHASELLLILNAANITDPFAYKNVIKGVAPILEYPMTEWQMKQIVAPVTDTYYRHKLYDELVREQMRNQ